jgi:linoleoyl-CoA desaturase
MTIKYPVRDEFYQELTQAVGQYFVQHNKSEKGDWRLHTKTFLLFTFLILTYQGMLHTPPTHFTSIVYGVLFGIIFALIGFNIMHDGSHGAYSHKKWVNTIMRRTADMMGASAFMWYIKHKIIHHSMTNTEADDDLKAGMLFRMSPLQILRKCHKYQHIYGPFLYGLLFIVWVWYKDFIKYFSRKINTTPIKKIPREDHFFFWGAKLFHFVTMILIPCYFLGVQNGITLYVTFAVVCGFLLSVVFQLAHVVEKTIFLEVDKNSDEYSKVNKITLGSWASLQVKTTCDFAIKSRLARILLGGLNFQTVHHLFPEVSHVHYADIQPIVVAKCQKYGITYNYFDTMEEAFFSHLRTLKKLGAAA